jgi:hypothetical protein
MTKLIPKVTDYRKNIKSNTLELEHVEVKKETSGTLFNTSGVITHCICF